MTTHKARKRFGQNFLQDYNVIAQIIACIRSGSGQHWVEIGPGQGALTEPLLQHASQLDVIELDRDLVNLLEKKFSGHDNLRIHSHDALDFDFSSLYHTEPLHIIGNLPYNISTPILFHLLDFSSHIGAMYFMLQKEVVDRICAKPGSKKYGRLSIMLQYHCETEFLFDVAPESFDPIPKVMSSVVRLSPFPSPPYPATNQEHFNLIVSQAFSQRRKTLRNSLKKLVNEAQMHALQIDASVRPESLSVEQFVQLSNTYSKALKETD